MADCPQTRQEQEGGRRRLRHIRQAAPVRRLQRPRRRRQYRGLVQIVRERREVFGVHHSIVIEVALVPHAVLIQVVRERREVLRIDDSIKIRVTQQGEHDFDGIGGQAGWIARIGLLSFNTTPLGKLAGISHLITV